MGKTVIIISPQSWGKMLVSKHHYAIELARMGYRVFFLSPPDYSLRTRFSVTPAPNGEGVILIEHRPPFPYFLKFKVTRLFHYLMGKHIKRLLSFLDVNIDIVWSFDLGNIYPFEYFPTNAIKIFHPVDEPLNDFAFQSAKGADVIFSVTREILEKYRDHHLPGYLVNHGVDPRFLLNDDILKLSKLVIGFSGNLLRPDIDREVLLEIIDENSQTSFRFWGSFETSSANLSGNSDGDTLAFIEKLKNRANVSLEGAVTTNELIAGYKDVSVFLICYDINKDQSKGTNYHKIMEFLATGRVIISNNVTSFAGRDDLLLMNESRSDNKGLVFLFKDVINKLDEYNSTGQVAVRRRYAAENTYRKQVERIEGILKQQFGH